MNYLNFGDTIDYNKYNSLVYLLRKFKKLTSNLTLGAYNLKTDYGNFHFSEGFISVGNNWILENNVTVTSNNLLSNCYYTFIFTVIDVNTSGLVNKRLISVTSESTGETGVMELEILSDIINNDEVILPNFTLEVVFDEHEYYTPLADVNLTLSVDKRVIGAGEIATITGVITDSQGTPISRSILLNVNGVIHTVISGIDGKFTYPYTGTGDVGRVLVSAMGISVIFYDGTSDYITASVTGNFVKLGWDDGGAYWLPSIGDVIVDWGDGTMDIVDNPNAPLAHAYTDGLSEHLIIFDGTVTSIGDSCFMLCPVTSVTIPDSVTSIGASCFWLCWRLTSISIPDSVTSIGASCFGGCDSLINYDLYWENNPITYDVEKMPVNSETVFTIPYGTTPLYIDAQYPISRLVEREPSEQLDTILSIGSDKQSLYTDETLSISGLLVDEKNNPVKQAIVKLYDGNALIDTVTTDNLGVYSKTVSGLSMGNHIFHASFDATTHYNASVSSDISVTVSEHSYNLVLSSDTPIIQTGDNAVVTAVLTRDGVACSGQSLSYTVKHDSTTIDSGTVTTGNDGTANISYMGTGAGDVVVSTSFGSFVETCTIEDVSYYDMMTSNNGDWTFQTGITPSYSSNGALLSANRWGGVILKHQINTPSTLEFEITSISGLNTKYFHLMNNDSNTNSDTNSYFTFTLNDNNLTVNGTNYTVSNNGVGKYKLEIGADTVKFYLNDNLITTVQKTVLAYYFTIGVGTSSTICLKNLKLKRL